MPDKNPHLPTLLKILDDAHAIDIVVIDVSQQTSITDYMIICTGRSSRHVKAIGTQLMEQMKVVNLPALNYSGFENAEWALIDFGDFIVHAMQADTRLLYNLEGLWQDNTD